VFKPSATSVKFEPQSCQPGETNLIERSMAELGKPRPKLLQKLGVADQMAAGRYGHHTSCMLSMFPPHIGSGS